MKLRRLPGCAIAAGAMAAVLSGCGGPALQAVAPLPVSLQGAAQIEPSQERTIGRAPAVAASHAGALYGAGKSRIAPDLSNQDLLYVSSVTMVGVYSYPEGKLVERLSGFYETAGDCVDKRGDVFIVNLGTAQIFEYAHGAKRRLATLKNPSGDPVGCSIDPTTGNLAVASLGLGVKGTVAIYKNARGKPTTYTASKFSEFFYCGYDDKGDLFVDGQNGGSEFEFAELPKGSSTFTDITLNQAVQWPGQVQWHDGYVAVADQQAAAIYQFAISGSTGTLETTTDLKHVKDLAGFWIRGLRVVVASVGNREVQYWPFPAGGKATKVIQVNGADGVAISPASR